MDDLLDSTRSFILCPPRDVGAWAAGFEPMALPVLAATASEIEVLRATEDDVDAHLLAEAVGGDPLLILKVMAHVAQLRREREGGEPETLTAALIMLGIPPFFSTFAAAATVEDRLVGRPEALAGFRHVLDRCHRAARFAMAFAVHRMDHDAAVIREAALLHDFAELLLWLKAPDLALQIASRQLADTGLRSAALQRDVLNVELVELQHLLMLVWRLPSLLVSVSDARVARGSLQWLNVRLAVRVATHSARGWDNAALPEDMADIGSLLQLSPAHVERLLQDIDSA
jgi:HD-like signal output (HDOD) protein